MTTHNDLSESQGPVTHFREIANQFQNLGLEVLAFGPDVIYSRQSYITLASPLVALILGIRLVSGINGLHVEDLQGRDASWIKKAIRSHQALVVFWS
jgi:hypothetical protein